jgi:glycosyltransferase involved in cell wall biosynthesis
MKKNIAIIENNIISTLTVRNKLTKVLIDEGHKVTILTTGTDQQLQKAKEQGFEVINIKTSSQNPADVLIYMKNLHQSLKKIKADVCLTFTIRPAIWGNLITRVLGIPTITNITGVGPLFESDRSVYRFARMLYKYSLKKTSKIFFQNKDDMSLFIENKFIEKNQYALIPGSGIDHEHFKPIDINIDDSKLIFLFIGRLLKDKGVIEFVESARKLKSEFNHLEFRIIGPLWLQNLKENTITQQQLDSWINHGIINYIGEVSDVRSHISNSHCLVLPSYREGTSNVLLEASSMERPCITCDTTGCREIVEDGKTGFLCKVADIDDLTEKMKKLILLPKETRIQMGKNARQKVMKEFDKKIVIDAYLNAIEKYGK